MCMNCLDCDDCVPIGEGDHICILRGEPVMVIEDYVPNQNYIWCSEIDEEDKYERV